MDDLFGTRTFCGQFWAPWLLCLDEHVRSYERFMLVIEYLFVYLCGCDHGLWVYVMLLFSRKDCVHNIRDYHHELLSLVDPSIIAHGQTWGNIVHVLLVYWIHSIYLLSLTSRLERWLGHSTTVHPFIEYAFCILMMIAVGYENVAEMYIHIEISRYLLRGPGEFWICDCTPLE